MRARGAAPAAEDLGLVAGTPVVAGAGDQGAGAVGMGILMPGIGLGDHRNLRRGLRCHRQPCARSQGPPAHLLPCCAGPLARDGRNAVGGAILPLVPRYLRGRRRSMTTLTAEAAKMPAGSDGLLWAPYLLGERTPHLDSQATAAFVGITAGEHAGSLCPGRAGRGGLFAEATPSRCSPS